MFNGLSDDELKEAFRKMAPWIQPLDTTKCTNCSSTVDLKLIDIKGCNAYGDREVRRMMYCKECRKKIKGIYRLVKPK